MKKKMVVFYSLMFLPLVVVLIALQFLPELIPAHYDMNNQVTRWGSKYETLIFPVITVLFGYFMLAMAKLSSKQEENGSNNKNVCIVTGIASLALFNAMTVYFLYADFNSIENLSSIALDLNQLVFGLLGVEKLKQDEQNAPEKYSNCGQLFRLPDGLPIAPELLTKWYRLWRAEHPEFEQIVFHGLRHSSATYQLLQSEGDFKSVQGNTGHATAAVLMDTYAHTQDKPRLELTEKIEANFYSQDLTPAAPQPRQNEKPAATKISGKEILEAIRLMDADERRELTRALFA